MCFLALRHNPFQERPKHPFDFLLGSLVATSEKKKKEKKKTKKQAMHVQNLTVEGFFDQDRKRVSWYNNRRKVSVSKRSSNQINAFIAQTVRAWSTYIQLIEKAK